MKPLHKTTEVPLSPAEAFDLFLRQIDLWWPKDSHAPLGPDAEIKVEAHKGGRIIEVGPNGTKNLWGRIIGWDPDRFLAFTWFPEDDEDSAKVVSVAFHPTDTGTRLDLTLEDAATVSTPVDAVSTSYLFGWDLVLGSYAFVAQKELAPAD